MGRVLSHVEVANDNIKTLIEKIKLYYIFTFLAI